MESLPDNGNNFESSGGGHGPGFEPEPNKNPNKNLSISGSKRKSNEDLEQSEVSRKKIGTSSIYHTNESKILNKLQEKHSENESKILNKLQEKHSENEAVNNDSKLRKIFPDSNRDIVLYTQNFREGEKGDIEEVGIDDNGILDEVYYNKDEQEGPCDCCGNKGTKNCSCGGPKNPVYSNPMPPPAPKIIKPLCKDRNPNPGMFSREFPCCKCRKPFGNYKCSICNCIYC